jgi:hypothetical protein
MALSKCILWEGGKTGAGYGDCKVEGKSVGAHRIAWMKANNQAIPPNMVVMHTCDTPLCVNPEHLKLGTVQDNVLDAFAKGRRTIPTPYKSLNRDQVKELRVLYGLGWGCDRLAAEFKVSRSAAYNAAVRNSWRDV